ncbi:MAG TPA: AI-2E family transporter [Armatimonadota bacterium]|nr:AI-2E family transporter [Armatimonadota bacterium]
MDQLTGNRRARRSGSELISPTPTDALRSAGAPPHRVEFDIAPMALVKLFLAFLGLQVFLMAWPVLIVVLIALMIAAAFNPLVRRLQERVTRTWAVLAVVLLCLAAVAGAMFLIIPPIFQQAATLIHNAPTYLAELQSRLKSWHIHMNVSAETQGFSSRIFNSAPHLMDIMSVAAYDIAGAIGLVFLSIYFLIEGPRSANSVLRLLPRDRRLGARNLAAQLSTEVGGYIRGQIITSLLAAIFTIIALTIIGVPFALALGALAGLFDAVPVVGILMGLVPPALVALTTTHGPFKALLVVIAYVIYHQLESHIIAPNVYGNTMGLPLTIVVISFLVGFYVLGIVGAIIALPVAAAIPSILHYIEEWQEDQSGVFR